MSEGKCDSASTTARDARRPRRGRLRGVIVVTTVAAIALGLSACGGGPAGSGVAKLGTTTSTNKGSGSSGTAHTAGSKTNGKVHQSALQFSKCMRSHGVHNFPDSEPGQGFVFNVDGFDPNSASFKAAQQACRKYLPSRGNPTPSQTAQQKAQLLRYAKCMRAHGVTNFPDPTKHPGGGWGFDITGTALHATSPTYQAATKACEILRGGGHPCSGSRRSGAKARRC